MSTLDKSANMTYDPIELSPKSSAAHHQAKRDGVFRPFLLGLTFFSESSGRLLGEGLKSNIQRP